MDLGVDRHELEVSRVGDGAEDGKAVVEVQAILSKTQVRRLRDRGIEMEPKVIDGQTVTQRATAAAAEGYEVFRTYSGEGGLKEEYVRVAGRNPKITKLVNVGQTANGEDIIALKVTKNARQMRDGKRPSVLYLSAQHAREWITPEMNRRLMNYVVDGYSTDSSIRRLLDKTELWFIPVANPDGYDFTFQPGQRLWRKNLRDNNGDGQITPGDGVDLNRNFPTKWGYDNEGSSPSTGSETYRGPGPGSEPETMALDRLARRVGFEFLVNYHSAAELLLYGTGWQVSTPTPDDLIYEAMAGDDADPAIPGYDPDISAELYTTNGDTDTELTERYRTLGFTPEMATCETASQADPNDEWVDTDCDSGFNFPDDEALVQAEFEKNIPFALSVAQSADDPDDPESVVGLEAPDFRVDTFDVSYGDPQTVAVTAKRALRDIELYYRIDGGRVRDVDADEWDGGERYGDENDDYYAEYRGRIHGADEGESVEAWFTATRKGGGDDDRRGGSVASEHFTYTVESDTNHDVLLIANEDYTGVNPGPTPSGATAPKYVDAHVAAIEDAGYSVDVWDVDAQGVPHDLGVLAHYDGLVWYLGDNRITQDPEDFLTTAPPAVRRRRAGSLGRRAPAVPHDGGARLPQRGREAGARRRDRAVPGAHRHQHAVGGLYYGLNGAPEEECVIVAQPNSPSAGFFEDCLILADDFRQYYLGAFSRTDIVDPVQVDGVADPFTGFAAGLGGPVVEGDNPLDEAGVLQPTSDALPVEDFPQFASEAPALYEDSPFAPIEGTRYAGALHADDSYARLTRSTIAVPASRSQAELRFQLSFNTEEAYDHVIVEARPAGTDNWTTLPRPGERCHEHRSARRVCGGRLPARVASVPGALPGRCRLHSTREHGTWNSFTDDGGGWQQVAFDLLPYAGQTVEVSVTYVTDPSAAASEPSSTTRT